MRSNALVDPGGLQLPAGMNCSLSSFRTPAGRFIVSWPSSTLILIDSHLIACCFWCLLLSVLRTIFKSTSGLIFLVATIAASRWTNWLFGCCCRMVRKMITNRSERSWRFYSQLQVQMERLTANLHLQFKLNPAGYRCRAFQRSRNLH